MKRKTSKITTIVSIMILLSAVSAFSQVKKREIPTATICQLNQFPSKYEGKTVRIAGVYVGTFEHTSIIDNSCAGGVQGVEFDCLTTALCEILFRKLNIDLRDNNPIDGQFVKVVAVGRVKVKDIPKGLNEWNIAFNVMRIEKTSPID